MDPFQQLRIETPEQIVLELPIAGIGSRFLAMAIDTLVQAVLYAVILAIAVLLIRTGHYVPAGMFAYLPAIVILLLFCVYWGYFAAFEIAWRGQTPGKRFARLRVIRDSGRPLDAGASLLRNLLRAIDVLPVFYGAGVICMILNRQSKRLGDFVAGTVVIHDRPAAPLDTTWAASPPATAPVAMPRASEADILLVETFLQRRNDLDWQARDRAADRVVAHLKDRLGVAPAQGQSREEFLEMLARAARDTASYR